MNSIPFSRRALLALLLLADPLHAGRPADADDDDNNDDDDRRDAYRFLRLPQDRAERLKALQARVQRENRRLKERLEDRRDDLENLYRQYRWDPSRCERLRREIRDAQGQLLELHHQFQVELRGILTEAEFERLQQKLREARRRRRRDDD